MPISPNNPANFEGGSGDFWDRYRQQYWQRVTELALLRDGMRSGPGGGSAESTPPHGLRFMDDVHAVGALGLL
jgi:hypothetical protein